MPYRPCIESAHSCACTRVGCRYINSYFKELIDGIFAYQGDVIKFAGDAMQVVWRNRGDSKATLAQLIFRASACCIHLLETLNNYSPPGVDDVTLKLHMGIGAGELSSFYLGGWEGKWEYFVAGEPIEQVRTANYYPRYTPFRSSPAHRRAYSLSVRHDAHRCRTQLTRRRTANS